MSTRILSYAASDVGRVRAKNEDHYFASDELGLYVLADGMGGHPKGEVASKLAVESVVEHVSRHLSAVPTISIEELVRASVFVAHANICEANRERGASSAMGTTLCVLLVEGQHFAVANVGDTRSYWVSSSREQRRVTQITHDDTSAASLILRGNSPDRVRGRSSSGLTQALGISVKVKPHVVCGMLKSGDMILICSDGITDYMPYSKFQSVALSSRSNPRDLVRTLIQTALDGGGGDNCTCICAVATSQHKGA